MSALTYLDQSISHGTLRQQDLLRAFAHALERLTAHAKGAPPYYMVCEEALGWADMLDEGTEQPSDAADELIHELSGYLNEIAPEGYYFGAHPGDGSDFGFWRIEE